jgi:hypothetical protein
MQPEDHSVRFEAGGRFRKSTSVKPPHTSGSPRQPAARSRKETFAFRGLPKNVREATTRVYLEATNFQWESRQWDSLVLGAELVDRRLQVHDFVLEQGHNRLTLSWRNHFAAGGTTLVAK